MAKARGGCRITARFPGSGELMFEAIFSAMKAWSMVLMLIGGLIIFGIGALLLWDFVSVRLYRRRVNGRIVGVLVTGARAQGSEEPAETHVAGSKPRESFSEQFRKDPKGAVFGTAIALLLLCVPLSFLVFGAWQSYDVLALRITGVVAELKFITTGKIRSDSS